MNANLKLIYLLIVKVFHLISILIIILEISQFLICLIDTDNMFKMKYLNLRFYVFSKKQLNYFCSLI